MVSCKICERELGNNTSFTIKRCLRGDQFKKIRWVRRNLKDVEIVILNEEDVYSYFKGVDITQYEIPKRRNQLEQS